MRKLVLSGFLASEEIYINQLEALLLVSTAPRLDSPSRDGWMDGWNNFFLGGFPHPRQPEWEQSSRSHTRDSFTLSWLSIPISPLLLAMSLFGMYL